MYSGKKSERRSRYKKKSQADETSVMSVKLVYMFALITGLFRSLVQFCLNSSFRCVYCHESSVQILVYWCLKRSFFYLLSSEVCSGPYALLSEQIIHHIFAVIAGLFWSLYLNVLRCLRICCHQSSVQALVHHCLTSLASSFRIIRAAMYAYSTF